MPVQSRDGRPVERVTSARGLVQTAQDVHKGGFSRTARAHDGQELTAPDLKSDAAHGFHINVARLVGLDEVVELNERRAGVL